MSGSPGTPLLRLQKGSRVCDVGALERFRRSHSDNPGEARGSRSAEK